MFGFLKKKLKQAVSRFTSEAEPEEIPVPEEDLTAEEQHVDDGPEKLIEEDVVSELAAEDTSEVKPPTKDEVLIDEDIGLDTEKGEVDDGPERLIEEATEVEEDIPEVKTAAREDLLEDTADTTKKKKGFFGRIKERLVRFQLTEEKFEELFWELELALLENGVAVEVIERIKQRLHEELTREQVSRRSVEQILLDALKDALSEVLDVPGFDLVAKTEEFSPLVICIVGVNGSGKTTTIGKIIRLLQKNDKSIVVAASDTFRAAAIQQLQQHTDKLGVKLIKHGYDADPAAVAFDAIKHAESKGIDVVLIDTAGRLQSNTNLMDELRKVVRVAKPHLKIFVGEAITGNDCVEQAVAFNEAVGIDGIILSKADIDEKGGAAISVSHVTGKPILYLGTGQTYDDLEPFEKERILASLGL